MTDHRLALSRSPRVPRSLDRLVARTESPSTPETPQLDPVLLATLADAVRQLQGEMETMRGQLAAMRQQIRDINYRESA